jgi:hypothetical protein
MQFTYQEIPAYNVDVVVIVRRQLTCSSVKTVGVGQVIISHQ